MRKLTQTVCKICETHPILSGTYDRFYCGKCDIWLDIRECKCGGDRCFFPNPENDKPSQCYYLDPIYDAGCYLENERTTISR